MAGEKNYSINCCGIECTVATDDRERLEQVLSAVEKHIRETLRYNSKISVATATLLASLEYCDNLVREQEAAQNMREQIREYISEGQKARTLCEELRRENERLKSELKHRR